jgi:predicted nuclease with TOPRIM domain
MTESTILELSERVHTLETENARLSQEKQKLSETVDWMHDLIWELIQKNRSMGIA